MKADEPVSKRAAKMRSKIRRAEAVA
jgi:hypothetical protein